MTRTLMHSFHFYVVVVEGGVQKTGVGHGVGVEKNEGKVWGKYT